MLSGLGVALSDTFYAIIAGFSLTYVINILKQYQLFFQIFGALALIGLGLHIFFKNPVKEVRKFRRGRSNYFHDFLFSFLVTFSNPLVALVFLAVFTGSGVVLSISEPYQSFFIVLGIFMGCCLWWFSLTTLVGYFRHRFNLRVLWWFNKIAGVLIVVFVVATVIVAITRKMIV